MRVWALASCGGLLALAACSGEQSNSPGQGVAPPDGDLDAEVNAQARPAIAATNPVARPEIRPRPVLPSARRAALPATSARGARVAGQPVPQAADLRQRIDRLRAQRGAPPVPSRLVTTPLPTPSPTGGVVPVAIAQNPPQRLAEAEPTPLDLSPVQGNVAAAGVAAQPTIPGSGFTPATESAPEAATPDSGATDLGPVAAASAARNYPIAPLRHQGYSSRAQQPVPALTVASPTADRLATAPLRLHGATAAATPETAPETLATAPAAQAAPAAPEPSATAAPAATPAPENAEAALSEPNPGLAHQSGGTVALRPSPLTQPGSPVAGAHQRQGNPLGTVSAEARPQSAQGVPQPEVRSLPRQSTTQGAAEAPAAPAAAVPETVPAAAPEAVELRSQLAPPSSPLAAALGMPAPAAAALGHQRLTSQPGLIPELSASPTPQFKGVPQAYCLSASGLVPVSALELQAAAAPLPKFSRPPAPAEPVIAELSLPHDAAVAGRCGEGGELILNPEASPAPGIE